MYPLVVCTVVDTVVTTVNFTVFGLAMLWLSVENCNAAVINH